MATPRAPVRPGQAAIEMLLTNGWALTLALVVIGIFVYTVVFNPLTSAPKSCILSSQFTCAEWALNTNGTLYLDLGQATGDTVTVTGLGCGTSSSPAITAITPVTIPSGSNAVVTTGLDCGAQFNSVFQGTILVQYTSSRSTFAQVIKGSVVAPVGPVPAGTSSYLDWQWKTRKPVNVSIGTAQTNYPLNLTVSYSAGMNSDFSDLRFSNVAATAALPYYIESKTDGSTANVWVNVGSLNTSNGTQLYMYYNNSAATSESNGGATFFFYDGFDNYSTPDQIASLGGWGIEGAGSTVLYFFTNASSPQVHSGLQSMYGCGSYTGSCVGGWGYPSYDALWYHDFAIPAADTYMLEFYTLGIAGGVSQTQVKVEANYTNSAFYGSTINIYGKGYGTGAGYSGLTTSTDCSAPSTWQAHNVTLAGRGGKTVRLRYAAHNDCWCGCVVTDDVRVRKFLSPAPTYVIGSAQSYTG